MSAPSGLRMLRAPNPSPMTLDGTRTFIVGRARPVVIDPGPDDPGHRAALRAELAGVRPVAILLTHAHPDHAAGAGALARDTGAPIRIGAGSLLPLPFVPGPWLADGEEVECDAGTLRVLATPGHAPEHLAFHWSRGTAPERGALFVGDLLMGEGDTTLVAPPEGELGAYLASLDRVRLLDVGVLYPAHGPAITDPQAAVDRYRAHRLQRIEQVRAVLRAHPGAGPDELVRRVYGDALHPGLRRAAAGSIHAILHYLDRAEPIDPNRVNDYTAR